MCGSFRLRTVGHIDGRHVVELSIRGAGEGGAAGVVVPLAVSSRVVGFDVARAVAVVGMLVAHLLRPDGGWSTAVFDVVAGRAMPLFVVVAGVGVSFYAASTQDPVFDVVGRSCVLFVCGLALEGTTVVAVILHVYAFALPAAVLIRRWADRWLWCVFVLTVALGAVAQLWLVPHLPFAEQVVGSSGAWMLLAHPLVLLSDVFLSGHYPLFPTFGFVVAGMLLARRMSAPRPVSRSTLVVLMLSGASVAVFAAGAGAFSALSGPKSWNGPLLAVLDSSPHSQQMVWVVGSVGCAVGVIAAALLLPACRLVLYVSALGRSALSLYVVHVVALRAVPAWPWSLSPVCQLAVVVVLVVVWSVAAERFLRSHRQGPLEHVVREAGRSLVSLRAVRRSREM